MIKSEIINDSIMDKSNTSNNMIFVDHISLLGPKGNTKICDITLRKMSRRWKIKRIWGILL